MDNTSVKELGKALICIGHTLDHCKANRKTLEGIVKLNIANGTNGLADAAQVLAGELRTGLEQLAEQVHNATQEATAIADNLAVATLTTNTLEKE